MNRQRGLIPISLIMYGVAALAVMALLATIVYKVNHWCNASCQKQTARADAAEASIKAAQDRATAIALLWAGKVTQEDDRAKQRDADRTARFAPIVAASRNLPAAAASTVFPAAAVGVLDDAIRASNAEIARPPGEPAAQAATAAADPAGGIVYVANVTRWGIDVAQLYSACVAQVSGWQGFYAGLQQAQVAEQVH